jgi:predicted DsbA family dithiol-disulfide isomerase
MSDSSLTPTLTPDRTIKVAVVSDITCPWCYVGTKEIDRAIQRLELPADSPIKFELEHKPYLLNPGMPDDESQTKSEYIKAKLGKDRWEKVQEALKLRGEEVGIKLCVVPSFRVWRSRLTSRY